MDPRRDWNGKRGVARINAIHELQLIYMVNFTKPNHISRVFGGISMPMVSLRGAFITNKAGLSEDFYRSQGVANSTTSLTSQLAFWGSVVIGVGLGMAHFTLWRSAIPGMALGVGRFPRRSGPVLGSGFCLFTLAYSATTTMVGIPTKPMLKVFHTTSIKDRPNTAASDGAVKGRSYLFMVSEAM
jgi:hypothetical protein